MWTYVQEGKAINQFCGFKTLLMDIFPTLFQPHMWIISPKTHAISTTTKYVDIKLKISCTISKQLTHFYLNYAQN